MGLRVSGLRIAALGVLWTCAGACPSVRAGPPDAGGPAAPPAAPPVPKKSTASPVSGGSFVRRHDEYEALAAEGSERALGYLVAAYRRPLEPTERGRLVSIACDGFTGVDLTTALRAWREKDADEGDAWLWYRTLRREIGAVGSEGCLRVARDAKRLPVLRAAAIRALAAWADPALPGLVVELVKSDLGKEPGRGVMIEALGAALASQPGRVGDAETTEAFEALVPYLRSGEAQPRTRLALARALARWLDTPRTTFDVAFYRALLDRRATPTPTEDDRYAPPRFFGVEATGDRIVYVVDESGSMDAPLTEDERRDLREGAASARVGGVAHPATAGIPWDRLKTRRDAAVEFTKASLRGLPETVSFAVLLFDDSYTWIGGKPELMPATPRNVEAAVTALDRTRLGGGTNLHGGLRRAFDAYVSGTARRSKSVGETVEASELARGPTTIFLLSDGVPTENDWGFGGRASARGAAAAGAGAPAPFQSTSTLADDALRLNLFRSCEIHGIGIGEFSPGLLDRLTRVGHGTLRRIGVASTHGPAAPSAEASSSPIGRSARDALETLTRLGLPVPDFVRTQAADEAKRERAAAIAPAPGPGPGARPDAAPHAPPGVAAEPTLEEERAILREDRDASRRGGAARRLGAKRAALAIPDLVAALSGDADEGVRAMCDASLRAITNRGFGWRPGLDAHEQTAVRRNWEWWWQIHHGAIEREVAAAAAKRADDLARSAPATPPASQGTPGTPTK